MTQTDVDATTIGVTTETIQAIETEPEIPKLKHVVNPPMNLHIWREGMSTQDIVDIARVRRIEIVALCGYRWIPTMNPEEIKKTCDACVDEMGRIYNEES